MLVDCLSFIYVLRASVRDLSRPDCSALDYDLNCDCGIMEFGTMYALCGDCSIIRVSGCVTYLTRGIRMLEVSGA